MFNRLARNSRLRKKITHAKIEGEAVENGDGYKGQNEDDSVDKSKIVLNIKEEKCEREGGEISYNRKIVKSALLEWNNFKW